MKLLVNLLFLAAASSIANTASATVIPPRLDIDFRTAAWSGANNQHTFSSGGVTAVAQPDDSKLWQDSVDGLGIRGGEIDEIDNREVLKIRLDTPMALLGVWITDLFLPADGGGVGESGRLMLQFSDMTSTTINFTANDAGQDNGNGELFVNFASNKAVRGIGFQEYPDRSNNEFSVAGFVKKVPEPGTLALLGLGLLGFGASARKRAH